MTIKFCFGLLATVHRAREYGNRMQGCLSSLIANTYENNWIPLHKIEKVAMVLLGVVTMQMVINELPVGFAVWTKLLSSARGYLYFSGVLPEFHKNFVRRSTVQMFSVDPCEPCTHWNKIRFRRGRLATKHCERIVDIVRHTRFPCVSSENTIVTFNYISSESIMIIPHNRPEYLIWMVTETPSCYVT